MSRKDNQIKQVGLCLTIAYAVPFRLTLTSMSAVGKYQYEFTGKIGAGRARSLQTILACSRHSLIEPSVRRSKPSRKSRQLVKPERYPPGARFYLPSLLRSFRLRSMTNTPMTK